MNWDQIKGEWKEAKGKLRSKWAKLTDDDAFKGIKHGRKNSKGEEKMEAFGDRLSDSEISALVAYVRTFSK